MCNANVCLILDYFRAGTYNSLKQQDYGMGYDAWKVMAILKEELENNLINKV